MLAAATSSFCAYEKSKAIRRCSVLTTLFRTILFTFGPPNTPEVVESARERRPVDSPSVYNLSLPVSMNNIAAKTLQIGLVHAFHKDEFDLVDNFCNF